MLDFGFYNMDCMEGMKQFPDKYFDLAIVDPPYGIGIGGVIGGGCAEPTIYRPFDDSETPGADYFRELDRVSVHQIVWGGNYFLDHLNATKGMIVWDKGRRGLKFADCEIAWTNIDEPCRIYAYLWDGMRQEDMKNKEHRIHPTQKPVALYKWILTNYAKQGYKILDTHVGSASSLIACYDLGFDYVGFEIDEEYYKLATKRLEEEMAQVRWKW